ncbi:uncharacterized protein PHACADRAFT_28819 [Phanerochaete carnosa HHB-10118-sp]|uniref:Uncharacterized protein n=1 Tax=Phanerochaete carnosa (strain HHB-10118-sp) TaxID=650164 RepID=K5VWA3_PHACS|nr:uncharacterized protein PHACADRAFT_28819 [Phanerochaete carnosa HHB-10118-sp]EKM55813.1 hypothetical protein PHACADRAFT_28819 [Phanerochaete carnosa HHB-10118-sp]
MSALTITVACLQNPRVPSNASTAPGWIVFDVFLYLQDLVPATNDTDAKPQLATALLCYYNRSIGVRNGYSGWSKPFAKSSRSDIRSRFSSYLCGGCLKGLVEDLCYTEDSMMVTSILSFQLKLSATLQNGSYRLGLQLKSSVTYKQETASPQTPAEWVQRSSCFWDATYCSLYILLRAICNSYLKHLLKVQHFKSLQATDARLCLAMLSSAQQ